MVAAASLKRRPLKLEAYVQVLRRQLNEWC